MLGVATELDRSRLEAWLRLAASRLHEQRDALVALDQAIGDGDHGINMDRGFAAIVTKLDALDAAGPRDADPAALLRLAGKTLVSTVGGASGPLYGTGFLKLAASVSGRTTVDGAAIVAALDAATNGIAAIGRSKQGEKTMLRRRDQRSRPERMCLRFSQPPGTPRRKAPRRPSRSSQQKAVRLISVNEASGTRTPARPQPP